MNYLIRCAEEKDLEGLLVLYHHLHPSDDPLPGEPLVAQVWGELLHDPKISCLVVELDGILVATCTLIVIPNLTRGARPYALIENVVTHEAYRRRNIATQLMRHAQQMAWDTGCYKVMLLTGSKRDDVHEFYEKSGFVKGEKTGFIARP